jgi:hypothetical protein
VDSRTHEKVKDCTEQNEGKEPPIPTCVKKPGSKKEKEFSPIAAVTQQEVHRQNDGKEEKETEAIESQIRTTEWL